MSDSDHQMTASWGPSKQAGEYREAQASLIAAGKMKEAIMMDINDIKSNVNA